MSNRGRGSWYTRGGKSYGRGGKFPYRPKKPNNNDGSSIGESSNTSLQQIDSFFEAEPGPYKGWRLYFSNEGIFNTININT